MVILRSLMNLRDWSQNEFPTSAMFGMMEKRKEGSNNKVINFREEKANNCIKNSVKLDNY